MDGNTLLLWAAYGAGVVTVLGLVGSIVGNALRHRSAPVCPRCRDTCLATLDFGDGCTDLQCMNCRAVFPQ